MTAPDPLAPIRARAEAATPGPWEHFPITGKTNGLRIGGKAGYAELDPYDASFAANARQDVPALLAALGAVLALAEEWRYKGEFGWGPWQEGYGPNPEGHFLDRASAELRAAVSAALGGGA